MRLIIYDAAENTPVGWSWAIGARLFRFSGQVQHVVAARTWAQGLQDALSLATKNRITEVQFWGHGSPGRVYVAGESLKPTRDHQRALLDLSNALDPQALIWLRTCSSFAGPSGHRFALDLSVRTGRRVAGSTFLIGLWHSGQHSLRPGQTPSWPLTEGLDAALQPLWSQADAPNTLPFSQMDLPPSW